MVPRLLSDARIRLIRLMLSSPVVDQLRKLKRQKEEDLLTSPEYAEQKGVLLKQSRLTYEIEQEVKRRQLLEGHEQAALSGSASSIGDGAVSSAE